MMKMILTNQTALLTGCWNKIVDNIHVDVDLPEGFSWEAGLTATVRINTLPAKQFTKTFIIPKEELMKGSIVFEFRLQKNQEHGVPKLQTCISDVISLKHLVTFGSDLDSLYPQYLRDIHKDIDHLENKLSKRIVDLLEKLDEVEMRVDKLETDKDIF